MVPLLSLRSGSFAEISEAALGAEDHGPIAEEGSPGTGATTGPRQLVYPATLNKHKALRSTSPLAGVPWRSSCCCLSLGPEWWIRVSTRVNFLLQFAGGCIFGDIHAVGARTGIYVHS